jgi:hypothetical protein
MLFHQASISPYPDGDIRTDFSANGASRALSVLIQNDIKISLAINLLSNPDQCFRTGNRTKPTPLAPLLVNLYFGHNPMELWDIGIMEYWVKRKEVHCI